MPLFDITSSSTKETDAAIIQKSKQKATVTKKSGGTIVDRVKTIVAKVETALGKYADETLIIQDEQTLSDYIDACITEGICGIDTETTGLNPLVDVLVGVGIYTHGQKTAYIPLNHISYVTGQRVKNQLEPKLVGEYLAKLQDCNGRPFVDVDMFNAVFDIRFIKQHCGVQLKCTWDASLGARCLNENEPSNKLKKLHQKYILKGTEDAFSFDDLFTPEIFRMCPIKIAALYAAHDPKITVEYADWQRDIFAKRDDLKDVYWVFKNIEMPCLDAVVELEENGVSFDKEHNLNLQKKYHAILDEKEKQFHKQCEMYSKEIELYRQHPTPHVKTVKGKEVEYTITVENPVNIQSVPQLQALLYDIAKIEPIIDKKTKKPSFSTAEEVLTKLKHPLADAILEYRAFSTLVSTFIDKMPDCVNKKDGRIHCKFNQYGADTGRFSSSDPNLQNIPHTADIRQMFKATDGYIMMSADYSQQEIKGMAQMCKDEGMIEAFRQGKDFYAEIASVAFGYPYEECREFRPDGTTNPDGKARRAQAKSILLGINYGRGAESIAEQIGCSKKEAERIKELVFNGFPAIAEFERQSFEMAETLGYVTTLWGRKRRFPSMLLPDYEFEYISREDSLDPLDFESDMKDVEVPEDVIKHYMSLLNKYWGKEKQRVIREAKEEGILITDHTREKDYTKIVNARIQGTAADMTKLAMIALNNDERLKELGFRMLIPIHDEILAECPEENAAEVVPRFAKIMSEAPGEKFVIPISCDVEITHRWYGKKYKLVDGKLVEEEE